MARFFALLICIHLAVPSNASHLMGGEITWRTDSLNQFIFQVKLYRDCNGIPAPNAVTLFSNSPVSNITCSMIQSGYIGPSGPGCPSCINPMGYGNAVEEFIYESAPFTLIGTVPSAGWVFSYSDCCRNAGLINLNSSGSGNFTLRAYMFGDGPGGTVTGTDNSPRFMISPTLAVCPGANIEYSHVAYDPEMDSISYEWAHPLDNLTTNYPFAAGYSYNSPLPGAAMNPLNVAATLDPTDGMLRFKSYTSGGFVTVIKATSWKCGVKTAEIYREIQISVLSSCNITLNPLVPNLSPQLTILKAGQPVTNDTVIAGDSATYIAQATEFQTDSLGLPQGLQLAAYSPHFGANYTDPLIGCLVAPCATLTNPNPQSGIMGLSNTINFSTSCTNASYINGCLQHERLYSFTFKAQDDFCPANGVVFKTLNLVVSGPQLIINGNDLTVSLPGSSIQWYLNGVPIPGASDTTYTPTQNGVYSVIATVPGGCQLITNAVLRSSGVGIAETESKLVQNIYVDAGKQLQVIINSPVSRACRFEIHSLEGKLVRSFNSDLQAGVQHMSFSLDGISNGMYLLQTVIMGSKTSTKFYLQP